MFSCILGFGQKHLVKNLNRMANSVDPDETAHHEPSRQDLHCM